ERAWSWPDPGSMPSPSRRLRSSASDRLKGHRPSVASSDTAEPIEAAVLPVAAAPGVGDLHRGDPFRVLEAELNGGAQAQRKTERIGDRFPRVFGGKQGLGMEGRRHVDAPVVIVGAAERHVLGGEIGTNAFEELAQVYTRPLTDVIPALDADVADDDLLLRQLVNSPDGPRPLVGDESRQLELPVLSVHGSEVLDIIIGVEPRRLHHLVG